MRAGHGRGAGQPRIEVLPANELPQPVPAPAAVDPRPVERLPDGRLASSEAGQALGRLGGLAKARRLRLVAGLGLAKIAEDSAFTPYRHGAQEFLEHHMAELAQSAGGKVGAGPATMIGSAALQLAASRYAFDRFAETLDGSWAKAASQFADASRQNLLASFELAIREAKARDSRTSIDPLADYAHIVSEPVAEDS